MSDCPRKIKLYGDLAEFVGVKEIETEVHTAADAVKCLIGNYPRVENYMLDKNYKVLVNEKPKTLEELHFPTGQHDIKIVPVISGQGRGLGSILLGAALIGAAFMFPGAQFSGGFFSAAKGFSGFQAAVGNIGIALVLRGVSQMLSPVPPTPTEDPDNSFAFNSPVNTTVAGLPIPILYGERMVGSVVISAGINVVDN
jgi:predicted phage tail protein